jgi:hypothetical protein
MKSNLIIIGSIILSVGMLCSVFSILIRNENQRNYTILKNSIKIAQEWAYFEGQKDAVNGDVRIKYDEQSKKYSWIKSCWDGGLPPTFDPSHSENISYFLTKDNLLK